MPIRTATCACGQLRAVCEGEPARVSLCNCTQCQRRTGSAFGVNSYFLRRQMQTQGEAKQFTRSSGAGREVRLNFCSLCGSTVFWDLGKRPEVVGVAVGAIADPGFPAPHEECHWMHPPPRAIFALLLLAGCASPATIPQGPTVLLPPAQGSGDPGHQAVMSAADAFVDTKRLAGRPAAAARATAQMEWMAATLPYAANWTETSALLPGALRAGRTELRAALGIPESAPPDEVARALLAGAAAIEAGNSPQAASALDALASGGGKALLDRLQHLPPLPRTAFAASLARQEIFRVMSDE
jgi:hypothetical protein